MNTLEQKLEFVKKDPHGWSIVTTEGENRTEEDLDDISMERLGLIRIRAKNEEGHSEDVRADIERAFRERTIKFFVEETAAERLQPAVLQWIQGCVEFQTMPYRTISANQIGEIDRNQLTRDSCASGIYNNLVRRPDRAYFFAGVCLHEGDLGAERCQEIVDNFDTIEGVKNVAGEPTPS